jgi:N-acetylglutamate synthase-like GNAT family acetyltransferase
VRGQKLFVRPIEAGDAEAVRAFLTRHGIAADAPRVGLLGKLVGELVAVLSMDVRERAIHVNDLVVAPELRRKRIGRVMMTELDLLAAKLDRESIVVESLRGEEFFARLGFEKDGYQMRRKVGS